MKLYILASVIIFGAVIHHAAGRDRRLSEKAEASFWEREKKANETRKKSLEELPYIHIPLDCLPLNTLTDREDIAECITTLRGLADTRIVNLTGYTNTDLKLMYGTANITPLSQYDQSYTLLVSTLQKWADILWEAGYFEEAVVVMEFALSTETDVSRTYCLLAQYYQQKGDTEKLTHLSEVARALRSSHKRQILNHLEELS